MNCDDCLYTDIVDWEQGGETLKGTPAYWCERYKLFCSDVTDCKYKEQKDGKV